MLLIAGAVVAAAIVGGYTAPGTPVALAALAALFVVAWWLDNPTDVAAYLGLLGVQIPVDAIAFRLALLRTFGATQAAMVFG